MWTRGTKDRNYWLGFHQRFGLFLFDKQWRDEEGTGDPEDVAYVPVFVYGSTKHNFERADVLRAGLRTLDWYKEDRGISQDIAEEQIRRLVSYYEEFLDHSLANRSNSQEREMAWRRFAHRNEQLVADQDVASKHQQRLDQLKTLLASGRLADDDASFLWRNRDRLSDEEIGILKGSFASPAVQYVVDMSSRPCRDSPRTSWDVCEACGRPVSFCCCSS